MGFRFRKSIGLGAGVRLNFSGSGIGASFGMKGFRVGFGPSGVRMTASIPGTGFGYETRFRGIRGHSAEPEPVFEPTWRDLVSSSVSVPQVPGTPLYDEYQRWKTYVASITSFRVPNYQTLDWKTINEGASPQALKRENRHENSALAALREKTAGWRLLFSFKNRKALEHAVEVARALDEKEHLERTRQSDALWAALRTLAPGVLSGSADATQAALAELTFGKDLEEFLLGLEVVLCRPWCAEAWMVAKGIELVPSIEILDAQGDIFKGDMRPSRRGTIYRDYICAAALRVAGRIFWALPVEVVLVHVAAPSGDGKSNPVLSVAIDRERFLKAMAPTNTMTSFYSLEEFEPVIALNKAHQLEVIEPLTVEQIEAG